MPVYGTNTKKRPEEVVAQAKAYFGQRGLGLELTRENRCCVTLQGGGGYVTISASEDGGRTDVELETREWDYHVKQFMAEV